MTGEAVERDLAALLPPRFRAAAEGSVLRCTEAALAHLVIDAPPVPGPRRYRIEIGVPDLTGRLRLALGPGSGTIRIDTAGPIHADIRTWRRMSLHIDRDTTISSARIVCDDADVSVGRDGLWSDEILLQSNDQHGIIDLADLSVINGRRRRIEIGDHVWLGRRTMILPDVRIGRGAILGAAAVLTGDMPPYTIFGGVPARRLRDNVSWSRAPGGLSDRERRDLDQARAAGNEETET